TIYQWLRSIYLGEREPSRNEFDLDYTQNLREQIKTGQITREQAAAKEQDLEAKVRFEINNFFQMNNRTTYGRLSTYCPILREEEMIRSVEEMLVSVDKLGEALNTVRRVDFSCFYRDMLVSDEEKNLPRMEIKTEVMPEIVLMPTVGTRAMMWQEIGNQSRLSPARFTFPIFTPSDVTDMMIESCGRYRWEICRKIQGMRWNDIRENSLTAEYCDYLQFYRKNRDLTNEAREKVKSALQKGKNNYREVFVRDYVNWIKFEARGSMRLNKVARSILFRYCPLAKPRRRQMGESPVFREMIERYEILTQKEKEKVEKIFDKYEKSGGELLPEMKQYLTYFEL
ncbi:MAG: cyclic nucleotide-binding domain-containing protein, partial [Agathobacter sp.]|nr:cyclic nucleotide-binding domain-containing protein [Agathobacter sp.]